MLGEFLLPLFDLAPNGVYPSLLLPKTIVSSYLTFSPLPTIAKAKIGGYFLRHFPSDLHLPSN
jgi:hypothetical protein